MAQWLKLLFQRTQLLFLALTLDGSQLLVITTPRARHPVLAGGWAHIHMCTDFCAEL